MRDSVKKSQYNHEQSNLTVAAVKYAVAPWPCASFQSRVTLNSPSPRIASTVPGPANVPHRAPTKKVVSVASVAGVTLSVLLLSDGDAAAGVSRVTLASLK